MLPEEVQTSAQIRLDDYTAKIKKTMEDLTQDFFRIGYYLWEIRNFGWYKSKGYKDIVEFAEAELNFKKRSTYNFIAIVENFAEWNNGYPKFWIDEKYRKFGYSQLAEMLSLAPEARENINPDMTVKQIRETKKEHKANEDKIANEIFDKLYNDNVIDVEFKQDQELLKTNQTVIDVPLDPGVDYISFDNIRLIFNKYIDSLKAEIDKLRGDEYHRRAKQFKERINLLDNVFADICTYDE